MRPTFSLLHPASVLRQVRDRRVSFRLAGAAVALTVGTFGMLFAGCYAVAPFLIDQAGS